LTRANLLSQTREILGESTASTSWWDDNVLYQYIQDACNLISLAVPIEKFDTLITASGTFMYGLNSDFIGAKTIFRKAGTQITAMQQIKPEEYYAINIKSGDTLKIYFMIFGNDSLTPKTIPKRRLEAVGGRVFSNNEIAFWRIKLGTAKSHFLLYLTTSILGYDIVKMVLPFSSILSFKPPSIRNVSA